MDDSKPLHLWTKAELKKEIEFLRDEEIPRLKRDRDPDLLAVTRQFLRELGDEWNSRLRA